MTALSSMARAASQSAMMVMRSVRLALFTRFLLGVGPIVGAWHGVEGFCGVTRTSSDPL